MMQKVVASEIFKDQKDSYPQSVGKLFLDSRLGTRLCIHCLCTCYPPPTGKHKKIHRAFLLLYTEREQISLKVVQTLGNDKVQVGLFFFV